MSDKEKHAAEKLTGLTKQQLRDLPPNLVRYPRVESGAFAEAYPELVGKVAKVKDGNLETVACPRCGKEKERMVYRTEHGIGNMRCETCDRYIWLEAKK